MILGVVPSSSYCADARFLIFMQTMENPKAFDELIKEKLKKMFNSRLEDLQFNSIEKSEDLFLLKHETLVITSKIERLVNTHEYILPVVSEPKVEKKESLSKVPAFSKGRSLSNCFVNKSTNIFVNKKSRKSSLRAKTQATPNKTFRKYSSEPSKLKTKVDKLNTKSKLLGKKTNLKNKSKLKNEPKINENKLQLEESSSEQNNKSNEVIEESNNVRYLLNKNRRKTQDTFGNN